MPGTGSNQASSALSSTALDLEKINIPSPHSFISGNPEIVNSLVPLRDIDEFKSVERRGYQNFINVFYWAITRNPFFLDYYQKLEAKEKKGLVSSFIWLSCTSTWFPSLHVRDHLISFSGELWVTLHLDWIRKSPDSSGPLDLIEISYRIGSDGSRARACIRTVWFVLSRVPAAKGR